MRLLTPVLDLLAPSRCLACRRRGDLPWCPACAPGVRSFARRCDRCDARLGATASGDEPGCPMDGSAVAEVVAAHDYGGSVAAAIRGAKIEGCPGAYPPLARALAAVPRVRDLAPTVDVVTSVPVPTRRRRRRGFDHAALLAGVVATELDRPVATMLSVTGRAADRGAGGPQVEVAGMEPTGCASGHVLLVDDVVTTGATARAAGAVLVRAGATRVSVAAVARAGTHAP